MFLGRDFLPVESQSARLIAVDLANLLQSTETISAVTATLALVSGTDQRPDLRLVQPAQFSGGAVSQLVLFNDPAALLLGNRYALAFGVTTSLGQRLAPWSRFALAQGFGPTGYANAQPPASARGFWFAAAPLFYTLPIVEGGYVGQDYPLANQGETLLYGLDFSVAMSPGETISSASASLFLLSGTDAAVTASPSAYAVGAPRIAGNIVQQMTAWPSGGNLTSNIYALNLTATTSFGQFLTAWSRIAVSAIG